MRPTRSEARPQRPPRRPDRPAWLLWATSGALAVAAAAAVFLPEPGGHSPLPGTRPAPPAAVAAAAADAATTSTHERRPLTPQATAGAPATPTFADYLERLVHLGVATAERMALGDEAAAHRSDDEARVVFAELMARIDDAPEQALASRGAALAPAVTQAERLRRRICVLVLAHGLQQHHDALAAGGSRARLDTLVAGMLALLPAGDDLPEELGRGLLADRPYLGLAHETAVLALIALAGENRFPTSVAVSLLLTLWRNLERDGVRSDSDLAALALLWLEDGNPSARAAAACKLLTAAEGRFVPVLLERVRASGDRALAREVALAAARELDPVPALGLVEELARSGTEVTAAVVWLATRDPVPLQQTYQQRLADGVQPAFRAELVSGLALARTPEATDTIRLAFQSDPARDVRLRAMFALTATAADALGEQTVQQVLDDPRLATDPQALGAAVLALENLERAGLVNAVDRLAHRLRATAGLSPHDRRNLERIVARALPDGASPR